MSVDTFDPNENKKGDNALDQFSKEINSTKNVVVAMEKGETNYLKVMEYLEKYKNEKENKLSKEQEKKILDPTELVEGIKDDMGRE